MSHRDERERLERDEDWLSLARHHARDGRILEALEHAECSSAPLRFEHAGASLVGLEALLDQLHGQPVRLVEPLALDLDWDATRAQRFARACLERPLGRILEQLPDDPRGLTLESVAWATDEQAGLAAALVHRARRQATRRRALEPEAELDDALRCADALLAWWSVADALVHTLAGALEHAPTHALARLARRCAGRVAHALPALWPGWVGAVTGDWLTLHAELAVGPPPRVVTGHDRGAEQAERRWQRDRLREMLAGV